MHLTAIAKENLTRLWLSDQSQNHDLAFQMLVGFTLDKEDAWWLWNTYQSFQSQTKERITLLNLAQLSKTDIRNGKILAILLENGLVANIVLHSFFKKNVVRIPYTTLQYIPSTLYTFANTLEELIWQDGEIKEIDENIIQFQQLRRLDLRRQPIEMIHPILADLPLLEEVHLVSTSFLPQELSERNDVDIYTDAPY